MPDSKPILHGIYRHYKGDYYIVEAIAKHSETGEELVIYRGLYADTPLWARPKDLFIGKITPEQAKASGQTHRFELQQIPSKNQH